ncbi:universal stress protein [Actinomadura fibrosa]|uniref:Universal stress protein n=2 Tax=Actinomadura fibrosa TaxID=111802 RepID=A0ABW2XT29_9ACTN
MSAGTPAVIVGTDGSAPSQRAVGWAADDAARLGAPLHIVHVVRRHTHDHPVHSPMNAPTELGDRALRDGRALALERRPDLDVETFLTHDRDVPAGLRSSAAGGAAEVVIGNRGRGGFAELLLGSTGLHLAGYLPGPVVVVRGTDGTPKGEVVVGLDLVQDPSASLDFAFTQAATRGAHLRPVHIWQPTPYSAESGVGWNAMRETYRRPLAAILEPWRSRHPNVKVIEEVLIGHPVDVLVGISPRVDLIVLGSQGHMVPFGSVSHGTIHYARCPVAVVHPRGQEPPGTREAAP